VRHCDVHFYTLYKPLGEDPAKCFNSFRIEANAFDELLSRVDDLKKSDTNVRAGIKPEELLANNYKTSEEWCLLGCYVVWLL
jgi:hypothetical protein